MQIAEDENGNLVHLTREPSLIRSPRFSAIFHSHSAVESFGISGSRNLGSLRHRMTGTFKGNVEKYLLSLRRNNIPSVSKEQVVRSSGLKNIVMGVGTVLTFVGTSIGAVQVVGLWDKFAADGMVTGDEFIRMGIETAEIFMNPIGSTVGEGIRAARDGTDIISVAEEPQLIERSVEYLLDGTTPDVVSSAANAAPSLSDGVQGFVDNDSGSIIAEVASWFLG